MYQSAIIDLAESGLVAEDMHVRDAGPSELAAVGIDSPTEGYVIPYFDVNGEPLPFYRLKLFNHAIKYKQPKDSSNHIYFPPNFLRTLNEQLKLQQNNGRDRSFLLMTEGEKKAAAAVKQGIPAVAVGGVDSWRSKTVFVSDETQFTRSKFKPNTIGIKLPENAQTFSEHAIGFDSLVDIITKYKLTIIVVYDTDEAAGLKPQVQRAAAALGYELRFLGVPVNKIRLMVLPMEGNAKVGLDDYLTSHGEETLRDLIEQTLMLRSAFPRHPNPRGFINKELQTQRLSRKQCQHLGMTILSELDAKGRRLRSVATEVPYYFDEDACTLMEAPLMHKHGTPLHEMPFGQFLYKQYGLSSGDTKIMNWLAHQFTAEDPIDDVSPKHVCALPDRRAQVFTHQINDSQYALVTADPKNPVIIKSNGSDGILFERDQVEPIDADVLMRRFEDIKHEELRPWWYEILGRTNLAAKNEEDQDHYRTLATLLFYINPWLNNWRGTQLPVEIVVGEAGSGKSSLYALRLSILTGRPALRNAPHDVRDWYASITNTGGLHVTDNVQFVNKDLKQRISDEMCRIVTEPNPHVEMRKLYTTSGQQNVPVECTFAVTAIQMPFHNADLLQRSIILQLRAVGSDFDGDWVSHQLNQYGGRAAWLAHHLWVLHKFLVLAQKEWNQQFPATHRLAHFQQCLTIMGKVFGLETDWLSNILSTSTEENISESDWTFEGLIAYANEMRMQASHEPVTCADITMWAQMHDEYMDNPLLTNSRKLGRYMLSHRGAIERAAKIIAHSKYGNKQRWQVLKTKD